MLTKINEAGKWTPNSVRNLHDHLIQLIQPHADLQSSKRNGMLSNLEYSLQHLEFIDRTLKDIKLTEVLFKQNIKIFVVVGASIIESLFYYILIKNGRAAKTDWKSVGIIQSHEYDDQGAKRKFEQEIFEKLPSPMLEAMSFDAMCKRVEQKGLARLTNDEFYKHIPHLRQLRNRIHLHTCEDGGDTDYFHFDEDDLNLTKSVLKLLLTSLLFPSKNLGLWAFLDP